MLGIARAKAADMFSPCWRESEADGSHEDEEEGGGLRGILQLALDFVGAVGPTRAVTCDRTDGGRGGKGGTLAQKSKAANHAARRGVKTDVVRFVLEGKQRETKL